MNWKRIQLTYHHDEMEDTELHLHHLIDIQTHTNTRRFLSSETSRSSVKIKLEVVTIQNKALLNHTTVSIVLFASFVSNRRQSEAKRAQCWPPPGAVLALSRLHLSHLSSVLSAISSNPCSQPPWGVPHGALSSSDTKTQGSMTCAHSASVHEEWGLKCLSISKGSHSNVGHINFAQQIGVSNNRHTTEELTKDSKLTWRNTGKPVQHRHTHTLARKISSCPRCAKTPVTEDVPFRNQHSRTDD